MKIWLDKLIRSIPYFHELLLNQQEQIRTLENDLVSVLKTDCDRCILLQGQLDYERERTTHLLGLLSPTRTVSTSQAVGKKSWNTLQNEIEEKNLKAYNDRRKQQE